MEIQFEPEFIYYPATGDYGGSQAPEEESVEITGIKIIDIDDEEKEYPALPKDMFNYVLNNFYDAIVKRALEMVDEEKD
jgi:hypothetical protein